MSLGSTLDAATAAVLADLAKVKAAAGQTQQAVNDAGKAIAKANTDLIAFVHKMEAEGIHTTAVDANGKLIDQSGIFEQEIVDMADQPLESEDLGKLNDQPFETGPGYDETIGGEPGGNP